MTDGHKIIWNNICCPECESKYMKNQFSSYKWAYEAIGVPLEYLDTEVDKIPCPKMREVATNWSNWKKRSLLLHGTTRLGKTRAAWEVYRRWWKDNYKSQKYITMRVFEKNIEEGFEKFDHAKRVQALINIPFLFIDDLGKEKITQRVACDLFAVVDERTINHRPTIITTNHNSAGLIERFDDKELAHALMGRFNDYFDKVGATKK